MSDGYLRNFVYIHVRANQSFMFGVRCIFFLRDLKWFLIKTQMFSSMYILRHNIVEQELGADLTKLYAAAKKSACAAFSA